MPSSTKKPEAPGEKAKGTALSFVKVMNVYPKLSWHGRYAHAGRFSAKREQKRLKTRLGRVSATSGTKWRFGRGKMNRLFEAQELLEIAQRIHAQQRHGQGKVYSLDAPEVECIAKGKAHKPHEFGVKVG